MNTALVTVLGIVITPWKLVGYLGVAMFTGRWFVQMAASRRRGQPTVPLLFWYMSIAGSALCLAYFIFGKNDSVGILSNAFPFTVALYNLRLALRSSQTMPSGANSSASARSSGSATPGRQPAPSHSAERYS